MDDRDDDRDEQIYPALAAAQPPIVGALQAASAARATLEERVRARTRELREGQNP